MYKLQADADGMASKIFEFKTVNYESPQAMCKDNNIVSTSVVGTIATCIPQNLSFMVSILTQIRDSFYKVQWLLYSSIECYCCSIPKQHCQIEN